jgi:hypothetical protein
MGPFEDLPNYRTNQEPSRNRRCRRPRSRLCLLKGCERNYRPDHPRQRYCTEECRRKAKKWHRWKAQQKYRATKSGKAKRNKQCQRRRERRKDRESVCEQTAAVARVIPTKFFRSFLRSSRLLRKVRKNAALSPSAFLLARVSTGAGARPGARTALERARCGARLDVSVR